MMHGWFTCVDILTDFSSELFDAGQFDDSSLRRGCNCKVLVFVLLPSLFPESLSGSKEPHRDAAVTFSLQRLLPAYNEYINKLRELLKTFYQTFNGQHIHFEAAWVTFSATRGQRKKIKNMRSTTFNLSFMLLNMTKIHIQQTQSSKSIYLQQCWELLPWSQNNKRQEKGLECFF